MRNMFFLMHQNSYCYLTTPTIPQDMLLKYVLIQVLSTFRHIIYIVRNYHMFSMQLSRYSYTVK